VTGLPPSSLNKASIMEIRKTVIAGPVALVLVIVLWDRLADFGAEITIAIS